MIQEDHVPRVFTAQDPAKLSHVFKDETVAYACRVVPYAKPTACLDKAQVAHDRGHEEIALKKTSLLQVACEDHQDLVACEPFPCLIHCDQTVTVTVKGKSQIRPRRSANGWVFADPNQGWGCDGPIVATCSSSGT